MSALENAAVGNGRAAWFLGRIHLDQRKDFVESEKWFTKALELQSANGAEITFDLARAVRARNGNWLVPLKRAADGGHSHAALALALELMAQSPLEARAYATIAANDPLLKDRARELVLYLERNGG
jgi:TPR repeat protein